MRRMVFGSVALAVLLTLLGVVPASAATVKVPCSASALQMAITNANASGGKIKLASNCIYSVRSPSTASEAFPVIVQNIEIVGGKATALRRDPAAGSNFRVFQVGAAGLLTLKTLTVEEGQSSANGGGVLVAAGKLVAEHVTFRDNGAANGGAVSVSSGATAVISRSRFLGNSTSGVGGGALIDVGNVTINRSVFRYNTAPINGGAINMQPGGVASVNKSVLRHNTSGGAGGGMSNLGSITLKRSSIEHNTGGAPGGGIASGNTLVVLHKTIVRHNTPDNCSPHTIPHCKN